MQLSPGRELSTLVLLVLLILVLVAIVWIWTYPPPEGAASCASYELFSSSTGICYIPEITSTSKYSAPGSLILADFVEVSNRGYWCTPTYYAARYIDQEGNYGPMGEWTTHPVVAGNTSFPGGVTMSGTCSFNEPWLGLESIAYSSNSGVWCQVYSSTSPKGTNPVPIGVLLPFASTITNATYAVADVVNATTYSCKCT